MQPKGLTYRPKKKQRARKTGFLVRNRKAKHILKSRRLKGRWQLTPKVKYI
jgi:ribosomal protein L34